MNPTSSALRTLKVAKTVVWDLPVAMLSPGVKNDRVARMGVRCVWFLSALVLAPPLLVVMSTFALPVAAVTVIDAALITSGAGSALGAAAVLGAAARKGKFVEQTRYWRDTVRDGLTDWRDGF